MTYSHFPPLEKAFNRRIRERHQELVQLLGQIYQLRYTSIKLLQLCIYSENKKAIYINYTSSEELSVKANLLIEYFSTWDLSFLLVLFTCIEPMTSPQARY